jgi:PAS domain S-box-containing protein
MSGSAEGTISVGRSLFLAFTLLALLTSAATMALVTVTNANRERVRARRLIDRTQDQTEAELRQLFDPIAQAVRLAKRWTERGLVSRYDEESLKALFLPGMRLLPQSCSMMVSDMRGYEFLILRSLGPGGLLETSPEEGAWITRDFRRDEWGKRSKWRLWDEAGETRLREWEKDLDYDPRPRVWHAGPRALLAEQAGSAGPADIHWTDVDIFFTSKTPGITASVATRDPAGELVVIGYDLLLSDLSLFTQRLRPSESGQVFVLNDEGLLVGLPQDPRFQDEATRTGALLQPLSAAGRPQLSKAATLWSARKEDGGSHHYRVEDEQGQPWWVGFRPYRIGDGQRLWIGVALPEVEILPSGPQERDWAAGIAVLALLVGTLLAALLTRRFVRPLQGLVAQSEQIAALDLESSGGVPSRLLEVRRLSETLENMRGSLAQHIAERRRAEEANRESEDRFRRLIENLPESYFFYSHDVKGVFTYLSPSVTTVVGHSVEEFLTHYAEFLTDDPVNEAALRYTELSIQGIRQPPYELELRHKDGSVRRLEVLEVPLKGATGQVVAVEGIARDITPLRASQRELEQAKEVAEAATQAKSQFLAVVSHELRTPLSGVLGMTALLLDTHLNETQRSFARTIEESGQTLLALVNDVLDFTKIELGKLELERVPFRPEDCIDSALKLVRPRAVERGLGVDLSAEGLPELVVGDGRRVRQILVNLVDNAIKFSDDGHVRVEASGQALEEGGYELSFSVSDRGIGIAPERLDRLFKSFSQVDASTTRKFGGTGLGLAISKRLCESMGGDISVESQPGEGSTFCFSVRVEDAPPGSQPEWPLPPRTDEASLGELASSRPLRILVAEDNGVNRDMLLSFLDKLGYSADTALDGREALAAIRSRLYDLVLLDVQMPEVDGLEVARKVKAEMSAEERPRLVAVTANAMRGDREESLEAGMDAYLSKPIDLVRLRALIASCTPVSRSEAAPKDDARVVLVVDDGEALHRVAHAVLAPLGFEVVSASTGRAALSAFQDRGERVACVLLDHELPDMSGPEVCAELRASSADLPVVLCSGYPQELLDESYDGAKPDAFLHKPFSLEALEQCVRALVPVG